MNKQQEKLNAIHERLQINFQCLEMLADVIIANGNNKSSAGRKLGLSCTTICNIIKGERMYPRFHISKLVNVFNEIEKP